MKFSVKLLWQFCKLVLKILFLILLLLVNVCVYDVVSNQIDKENN